MWTFLRTGGDMVFRCSQTVRLLRIDDASALAARRVFERFVGFGLVLPSWVWGLMWLLADVRRSGHGGGFVGSGLSQKQGISSLISVYCLWLPIAWALCLLTFRVLTRIEERGIQFFGRTRGWRITPTVARTVCAHATAGGWMVGVGLASGLIWGFVVSEVQAYASDLRMDTRSFQWLSPYLVTPATALYAIVFGLLPFELAVYFGVRACRYANPPNASAAPTLHQTPEAALPS